MAHYEMMDWGVVFYCIKDGISQENGTDRQNVKHGQAMVWTLGALWKSCHEQGRIFGPGMRKVLEFMV